jgi:ABC-2 type transport system ATP-binding protein
MPSRRPVDLLQDLFFLPEVFSLPSVTAVQYENLHAPFYPRFSHEQFRGLLKEFDITGTKKVSKFSYGQQKKFLVAFGLAAGCRLMLLDEPTNGLDIPSKSQFRKAVASSLADDQVFVISTHQVRDLESLIDPVIILDEGQIIFNESTERISNRLKVTLQTDPPDTETVFYSEKRLDGYMVVSENDDRDVSGIDLETLFNAVVSNRSDITDCFYNGENR